MDMIVVRLVALTDRLLFLCNVVISIPLKVGDKLHLIILLTSARPSLASCLHLP